MSTFINIQEIFLNIEAAKNRARQKLHASVAGRDFENHGVYMDIYSTQVQENQIVFRFEDGARENPNLIHVVITDEEHTMSDKLWDVYIRGMMDTSIRILNEGYFAGLNTTEIKK